ncbi:hypothetical protein AAC387_Pa04g1225 [Persea americana]
MRKLFPKNLPSLIFLSLPPKVAISFLNLVNENESPLSITSFRNGSPFSSSLFLQKLETLLGLDDLPIKTV